ncbi:MAG TPA: hypothetical protein VK897_27295 [Anaerolineales bacterium]|nr:hypothetical protein [Anaerolineales bacterium]
MTEDRIEQAIGLVQAGKSEEARELLEAIIKADQHNIPAWHWYAQTWPNVSDKIRVWEACLRYNPSNELAQEALRDLRFVQPRKANTEPDSILRRTAKPEVSSTRILAWLMIACLTALAVLVWRATEAATPKDPQQYRHVQRVEYYLYAPEDYSADREWPLFIGIPVPEGPGWIAGTCGKPMLKEKALSFYVLRLRMQVVGGTKMLAKSWSGM